MISINACKDAVRRNNKALIERIRRVLFEDMEQTRIFLNALLDLLEETPEHHKSFVKIQLRAKKQFHYIRERLADLSLEKCEELFQHFAECEDSLSFFYVLFGSRPGEKELAYRLYNLLLRLTDVLFGIPEKEELLAVVFLVIVKIIEKSGHNPLTSTWENVLRKMYEDDNLTTLRHLFTVLGRHLNLQTKVISFDQWHEGQESIIIDHKSRFGILTLPTPEDLYSWLFDAVLVFHREFTAVDQLFNVHLEHLRKHFDEYRSRYESMWLEMMCDPRYGLRPNGVDCASIESEAMRGIGYQRLVLYPRKNFPDFRAVFHVERPECTFQLGIDLTPSDLSLINIGNLPESDRAVWEDRLLVFVAVSCVWKIVTGRLHNQESGSESSGLRETTSAVVRPHFRRLPEGQQISKEAKQRALVTFQTTPLSGFTFVRGHIRGADPQSGAPIMSVRDEDLDLFTGS